MNTTYHDLSRIPTSFISEDIIRVPGFSLPYQQLPEQTLFVEVGSHASNPLPSLNTGGETGDKLDWVGAVPACGITPPMTECIDRRENPDRSLQGTFEAIYASGRCSDGSITENPGTSTSAHVDGLDIGAAVGKIDDSAPAWSMLKTKAGKPRKRLPLACITCRKKKIRCSGEHPACKQCLRSRIPCVYKVASKKAATRTGISSKRRNGLLCHVRDKCSKEEPVAGSDLNSDSSMDAEHEASSESIQDAAFSWGPESVYSNVSW